jgi:hypothetical protein
MKLIYIINGAAGVGKDTFVEIAKHFYFIQGKEQTYNISSVDQVKLAAKLLGWDGQKDEKGRTFLSDLKDISTSVYNGPYNYMVEQIKSKTKGIFFLHIREPEEIEKFKLNFPEVHSILVIRKGIETFSNHADKEVDKYEYDSYVYNDGTIEDLVQLTKNLVEKEIHQWTTQTLQYVI